MDPSNVSTLVGFLAPFIPYLVKAGEGAATEAGKKFSTASWDSAKALWNKLWPKVKDNHAVREAVGHMAQSPDNVEAKNALVLQLENIFAEDISLAGFIAEMVQDGQLAGSVAIANGERSVAVSEAKNSILSTGDGTIITKVN